MTMISLSSPLPPAHDESQAFFSLLKLVTDPAASAKRIADLHAAAEQAVEAVAAAKARDGPACERPRDVRCRTCETGAATG